MRFLALAGPFLLSTSAVHALPRHRHDESLDKWSSAFTGAWETLRDSTVGWYNTEIFDELQETFHGSDKTVLEFLEENDEFSNVLKLIKRDDEIKDLLDKSSRRITFFAPNNKALTPPHKRKDLHEIRPEHGDAMAQLLVHYDLLFSKDKHCDDRDKDKKKMLKAVMNHMLHYHILEYDVSENDLASNSTVPTSLIPEDGSYNEQNRRIRVERPSGSRKIQLNGYSNIVNGDNKVKNGYVHEIDRPLLPPPSILVLSHLFPQQLSTATSAIQKVGLEDLFDFRNRREDDDDEDRSARPYVDGTPTLTAFIPENEAWNKLPRRLVLYLFSPIGRKALTKLLEFHVVPKYIVHADWIYNGDKRRKKNPSTLGNDMDFKYPFPTALKNCTLPVHIKKTTKSGESNIDFDVMGQKVERSNVDMVARNGAVHILTKVLNPRKRMDRDDDEDDDDDEGEWDDWEKWLPGWANEEYPCSSSKY